MSIGQYTLFIVISLVAGAIATGICVYVWRMRSSALGRRAFAAMMGVIALWSVGGVLEVLSDTVAGAYFWGVTVRFTAIVSMPVLWAIFALQYAGQDEWLEPHRFILFILIPLISIALVWTNNYHGLFLNDVKYIRVDSYLISDSLVFGNWFWVHAIYSYTLLMGGAYLISLRAFRAYYFYRGQSVVILLGVLLPGVIAAFYTFDLFPNLEVNYTPVGFALSGMVFFWGIYRYRLFDLSPIARRILVDNMSDGMLVLNERKSVVDFNEAVIDIFSVPATDILGYHVDEFLSPHYDDLSAFLEDEKAQTEVVIEQDGREYYYDLRLSPIHWYGRKLGHLLIFRDITEQMALFEQVQRLAITDTLTGLYNRYYFFEQVNQYIFLSKRYIRDLSLIMLDIDHFKVINDTHGHAVGDEVLKGLANVLQSSQRQSDIVARYGGEEFVILLPESDLLAAQNTASRLCKTVETSVFETSQGEFTITISIGVASLWSGDKKTLKALLHRADQALYAAKQSGRNCVAVFLHSGDTTTLT